MQTKVVDILAVGKVFSEYYGVPLPASFHQCFIIVFSYTLLLPEGQKGEAWELPESNIFRQ
jgi:hypothetical protein